MPKTLRLTGRPISQRRVMSWFRLSGFRDPRTTNRCRSARRLSRLGFAERLVRMMDSVDDVTGPINLGNPTEYSMAGLADLVLAGTRSNSRLTHAPLPADHT